MKSNKLLIKKIRDDRNAYAYAFSYYDCPDDIIAYFCARNFERITGFKMNTGDLAKVIVINSESVEKPKQRSWKRSNVCQVIRWVKDEHSSIAISHKYITTMVMYCFFNAVTAIDLKPGRIGYFKFSVEVIA